MSNIWTKILNKYICDDKKCIDFHVFFFCLRSYTQLISDLDELKRVYEDEEDKVTWVSDFIWSKCFLNGEVECKIK